jgi:predicted GIY-YIG superfamily endonuclease
MGRHPKAPGNSLADPTGVVTGPKRFVFVLQSLSNPDRQYVESAADVSSRVASHNAGHSPLTASYRPWRLVTVVQFGAEDAALRFEKFLKTGSGRTLAKQYFSREDPR